MARRLPVCQVRSVSNLAGRLYYVDPARTFAHREFCIPNGFVQIGGEIDMGCHPIQLTDVRRIAGLDQISWPEVPPCAMVEPLIPEVIGGTTNAFVHSVFIQSSMSAYRL